MKTFDWILLALTAIFFFVDLIRTANTYMKYQVLIDAGVFNMPRLSTKVTWFCIISWIVILYRVFG